MKILNANCRLLAVLLLLVLEACTDYASQMEDDFEEWKTAQSLPSEGETVVSSSSATSQSNSSETSVSSSSVPEGYVDPSTVVTGEMTDARDGQTYKTVTIGTQTWMAQNLNYETANSVCYNDEASNCTKYGRLYTWAAAMDSVGTWSANGKGCGYEKECLPTYPVRGVCPDGWHLPTSTEFGVLEQAVGGQSTAGKMLKSTSGWYNSGNGTDAYSFAALPVFGEMAIFWSSTEYDSRDAIRMDLLSQYDEIILTQYSRNSGYSVRCVKDEGDAVESSSSVTPQSSSSETSVSSSSVPEGYVDPSTVVKGEMTDARDGQTYKTVTIGTQTWMAENLNYAYTGVPYNYNGYTSDSTSWHENNSASDCTKCGRLYTWAVAMDSVGTWSTNGKGCGYGTECAPTYPVRGVCPVGWHLPTSAEFEKLLTAVGGQSTAGKMLKSASGWFECKEKSANGTDAYAFSALSAGYRSDFGSYNGVGLGAYFWSSSTEGDIYSAYDMGLSCEGDDAILDLHKKSGLYKYHGLSVRCVKDD